MNEQDKKKYLDKFKKNVDWLRANVPRDDIYEFAEQALMASDYFLVKLNECVDITKEIEKDKILGVWMTNILGLRFVRNNNIREMVDTELKELL